MIEIEHALFVIFMIFMVCLVLTGRRAIKREQRAREEERHGE